MVSKGKRNLEKFSALLVQRFLSKWSVCYFLGWDLSAVARGGKYCCLLFLAVGLACGIGHWVDQECNI